MTKMAKDVEGGEVRRPYNIRERKEKDAAYRSLIRAELADELYDKIVNIIVAQKKYKDPDYSAKELASDLKTNDQYPLPVSSHQLTLRYELLMSGQ